MKKLLISFLMLTLLVSINLIGINEYKSYAIEDETIDMIANEVTTKVNVTADVIKSNKGIFEKIIEAISEFFSSMFKNLFTRVKNEKITNVDDLKEKVTSSVDEMKEKIDKESKEYVDKKSKDELYGLLTSKFETKHKENDEDEEATEDKNAYDKVASID